MEPSASAVDEGVAPDAEWEEWDDVFVSSYGPRLWNVGCG